MTFFVTIAVYLLIWTAAEILRPAADSRMVAVVEAPCEWCGADPIRFDSRGHCIRCGGERTS